MKVLVLSGTKFETKEIENTLEELQNIVGGYIEIPMMSKKFYECDIDMIINEEGKLIEDMNPEIAVVKRSTGDLLDVVMGNIIFASHDTEGNTIALNEEQIDIVKKELSSKAFLNNSNENEIAIAPVRVLYI